MKLRMLVVIFPLILTLLVPSSAGQMAALVPLPADLQGELDGVPYFIRVPANWNGTLLVYAYGYAEASMPLAPPTMNVETLLARGFALAGIHAAGTVNVPPAMDAGFNVKERMQNTVALTAAFHGIVGRPQRTIMWGQSLGGLVTLGMIEKFPGLYDGAFALCPPAAGAPRRFDQALDVALAYKAAFGWNDDWGTPGDLRDDLNFVTDVLPDILPRMVPAQYGSWEFIRRVNRIPLDTYYVGLNRAQILFFATAVRAELESRAGGPVAENTGRVYTLSGDDKTYLAGFGVNADALLAQMNATINAFTADRNARNYVEHYVNPSGRIRRPVLTLHTEGDWLATPNHEGAYRATVEQQGNSDQLMQQFVPGGAHCTFTSAQEIAGIDAMMYWLDTGNRPDPSFFSPALGFDPSFVPQSWPW
jgi:pimeloyl-ACP methyl ester carboxylesterase